MSSGPRSPIASPKSALATSGHTTAYGPGWASSRRAYAAGLSHSVVVITRPVPKRTPRRGDRPAPRTPVTPVAARTRPDRDRVEVQLGRREVDEDRRDHGVGEEPQVQRATAYGRSVACR